ncbi:tRNA pseudouridine(38-40) synthase TruA [Faecalicatena contorta]|uniref:tRNA pseudouridine(38-40) synthase TruA n=1 Tax=Faecalicatena contorta TaxID=39482 RepID=UPI001961632A|nr:tRNA pseudouridine(38-40) synthase TruA [Faecalicatena contorta]MBM6684387.1 tRNA pseudouridine(38-40) synthase TruA [Faecalicatena contorta]MBM6709301.1 tRNA pseudouridine(38-40) synthase TruA [Faecalicatena contorta]
MRNIKLTIEYDGSRYQGWVRLGKNESTNTISNKILEVIRKMTGEDVELFCGARTEVGVHAYGQTASFKTNTDMKDYEIQHYLNRYLPMDIAIISVEDMPERFHAQLNARSKIYIYRATISDVPSVFDFKYTFHCFRRPDMDAMKEAAQLLLGRHDFKNFSTVKHNKSTEREMYRIDIYDDGEEMQISMHADDFLHNMQRAIVGTLLDIGLGTRKPEDITAIFAGEQAASAPCDPKGMYLQEVLYE